MDGGATNYLLTQGVLGVAVVLLTGTLIYFQKKVDRLFARIDELQNLRLIDSKEVAKEVTAVLQENTQSNRILAEKIEVGKSIERSQR